MRTRTTLLAVLALFAAAVSPTAAADLSRFYGYYEGVAVTEAEGGGSEQRQLSVDVRRYGRHGFTVSWNTITRRSGRGDKLSENSVNFEPATREGVYGSAMRRNLFGEQTPLDPLKGEPFVWATVSGETMTVHSLTIAEDGGYEMQSYVRRLTATGLHLEFQRVRNGERLRSIEAELRRTAQPKDR